jgi:hypothetical protein
VRVAPFALFVAAATVVVGCGDDGGGATDAEAAAGACGVLVAWTNDVADIVNDAQVVMQDGADFQALMLAAIDDVVARTDDLGTELTAVDYPDTAGGDALAEELARGQQAAAEDIAGFREEILAIPDPDPEGRNFRKLVVELEKPRSLVKPDVQGDLGDEDLEAAIAAEDSCRFVTRSQ